MNAQLSGALHPQATGIPRSDSEYATSQPLRAAAQADLARNTKLSAKPLHPPQGLLGQGADDEERTSSKRYPKN